MQDAKLFDFMKNEEYKLMLDMSKENHEDEEDIKKRFSAVNTKRFYDICHEHELDGVVGCYAKSIGIPLPDYWEKEYERQSYRQNYLKEKAKEICELMSDSGIPMVILKNGGIMLSMIPEAVKCPMEDIDSLIKKQDFYKAHDILTNNGFTFKFRSEFEEDKLDEAYRHGSAEYYINLPDGDTMWFELSWRVIDGRWIRPDMEPDTKEFIERSFMPKGTKAHVLSAEDNLLQVCIHTAKHSYCRAPGLRLHMDVDRIVSHNEINWDLFLQKVHDTHVCTSTYISLYIPKEIFGTAIPDYVLEELKPRNINGIIEMLSKAGLTHPKEKKFKKTEFLRFQTALYDSKADMIKVIYPGKAWINEKYNCNNAIQRAGAVVKRLGDLVGIRKKK